MHALLAYRKGIFQSRGVGVHFARLGLLEVRVQEVVIQGYFDGFLLLFFFLANCI